MPGSDPTEMEGLRQETAVGSLRRDLESLPRFGAGESPMYVGPSGPMSGATMA
jgi:hypothetical protein